jgi:hypothetical protein
VFITVIYRINYPGVDIFNVKYQNTNVTLAIKIKFSIFLYILTLLSKIVLKLEAGCRINKMTTPQVL